MKNQTKCPHCGKVVTESQDVPFCSYFCGFQYDEINSRHVGAYGRDENGGYEDRECRYNYRYY